MQREWRCINLQSLLVIRGVLAMTVNNIFNTDMKMWSYKSLLTHKTNCQQRRTWANMIIILINVIHWWQDEWTGSRMYDVGLKILPNWRIVSSDKNSQISCIALDKDWITLLLLTQMLFRYCTLEELTWFVRFLLLQSTIYLAIEFKWLPRLKSTKYLFIMHSGLVFLLNFNFKEISTYLFTHLLCKLFSSQIILVLEVKCLLLLNNCVL